MKLIPLVLLLMLVSSLLPGQSLNNPESIVIHNFSTIDRVVYVSNAGDGSVVYIPFYDPTYVLDTVISGLGSIRGMAHSPYSPLIYAACDAGLAFINTSDFIVEQIIPLPGSVFPNDVVVADEYIFISDSQANKIYRLGFYDTTASVFIGSGIQSPNGMCRQEGTDNILLVSFRANSPIQSFNLHTGELQTVAQTNISNADGIGIDERNAIYISSWTTGSIYRMRSLTDTPSVFYSGLTSPADFCVYELNRDNYTEHKLFVPLMNINEVQIIDLPNFITYVSIFGEESEIPPYNFNGLATWTVAKELGIIGYDLLFADTWDGVQTQVNNEIIPSQNTDNAFYSYPFEGFHNCWWIRMHFDNQEVALFGPCGIVVTPNSDDQQVPLPQLSVYPNPLTPASVLKLQLKSPASISINLFDLRGRLLDKQSLGEISSGDYAIDIASVTDINKLSTGIYLIQVISGSQSQTRKLIKLD